jgi:4-amino-4-deoxy-L-arabinose transferase-like glycosyltransferase
MGPKANRLSSLSGQLVTLTLVVLLLLAFALRLYRVGDRSVWWDEGWSVWVARQPLVEIAQQTGHDVHPPLYFSLLHGWRIGAGDSEFGLRAFSAYLGTLTVAAAYLVGRAVGGKKLGLLAALFLTVSRFHIIWSQEIRMYSLAALLAVLAAWAAIRVWERQRPLDYTLYILFMTAGLYTLYLFFPVPVAANIAWLWVFWHSPRRWQALTKWVAAQLAILILLAPWMLYALPGFLSNSSATPISVADFLKIYWTVLVMGIPLNVEIYARFTIPVLVIFFVGLTVLIWHSRRDWRMARNITLFISGLLIPIAVVFYVTIPRTGAYAPPFSPRYLVIFTGYFSILLAWGILRLGAKQRWPLVLGLSLIVLVAAWAGLRSYHQGRVLLDDYKSLSAALQAYAQPDDAVILYSDRDWPIFAYHYPEQWSGVPNSWDITPEIAESYLLPIWEEHDGLWLVTTPYGGETDPQGYMPAWLEGEAKAITETIYGDKALHFFARTSERATTIDLLAISALPQFSADIKTKPGIQLAGYDLPSRTYHGGDPVYLGTYWTVDNGVIDESIDLQIDMRDRSGVILPLSSMNIEPDDFTAESGLIRKETVIQIPFDVPSGRYSFGLLNENGETASFADLDIRQRNRPFLSLSDVTIATPLDVEFESGIRLLGYELENDTMAPGEELDLTLYWQTVAPVARDYKVFTHLLGDVYNAESDNFLWAQKDNEPVNNKRPTTTWREEEVIVDPYEMTLPMNTPAGTYSLEIGLYDPISGERLTLVDEAGTGVLDHLILTEVIVR